MATMPENSLSRCSFIALLGAPNTGKSTLLNALVGTKLSIVTHKVQTTRTRIIGVGVEGTAQLVFIDTPGIFPPRRRLDRAMVAAAWAAAGGADIRVVLIDAAAGIQEDDRRILDGLSEQGWSAVLVLNKIDLVKRPRLLALAATLNETDLFVETFMVSALTGDGVVDLKRYFADAAPLGPWHYPADQLSDMPERLLAAEITREKIYLRLHQELPYVITVETESWEQRKDASLRIDQVIYVQRSSQKGIVLGKGGATIKAIGAAARRDLEDLLGRKVHLFLFVKVRAHWGDDPDRYREMGLGFVD